MAEANLGLGRVALGDGDWEHAARLVTEALDDRVAAGAKQYVSRCLAALGEIAVAAGSLERGARLLGAAAQLRDPIDPMAVPPADRVAYETALARASCGLGEAAFEEARARGAAMPVGDLVREVLEQV